MCEGGLDECGEQKPEGRAEDDSEEDVAGSHGVRLRSFVFCVASYECNGQAKHVHGARQSTGMERQ
jgi:hypothetical protein